MSSNLMPCLTEEERAQLLAIARSSVARYLKNGILFAEVPDSARLNAPGAAFVTLTAGGRLRGCVGYTEAVAPLYRIVQECAVAAATEDPRFPPVEPAEVEGLRIAVSVLSPLRPITAGELRAGVHGVVVSRGERRGLLLPQVAAENGWGAEELLEHACRKAGLPPDDWKHGADLFGFSAEVIEEPA